MLARGFELSALFLDLAEQPRVLDGEHGLHREGLQQLDGFLREFSQRLEELGREFTLRSPAAC